MNGPFFFCLLIIVAGCIDNGKDDKSLQRIQPGHSIAILPFQYIDTLVLAGIRSGLEQKLNAHITILEQSELPVSAFYKTRRRFLADSLLVFLRLINRHRYEKIIGVTKADISTRKGTYLNWGVMGLGECPGEACVISSFRVTKPAINNRQFMKRMALLALHELGHTYSLPHCPDDSCIMKDAEGKMNLDEAETYCGKCSETLRGAGILK